MSRELNDFRNSLNECLTKLENKTLSLEELNNYIKHKLT